MSKNYFYIFLLSVILVFSLGYLSKTVQADLTHHNVSGWAWSENIGWISFNSTNQQTGSDYGVSDYGVNVEEDGLLSGYAWSENIGWISFNSSELSGCPNGPCEARFNTQTGEISGWARACAGTVNGDCTGASRTDGWDGWIKLNNVSISTTTGQFYGWAWSDKVIGYISFNCQNRGVCSTSDYRVSTTFSFNQSPDKPNNLNVTWNHCKIQALSIPTFNWSYSDNDPQAAYEIKIYGKTDLDEIVSCSLFPCLSYTPSSNWVSNNLDWGRNYSWQVRVQDDQGNWSEWSDLNSFTMPSHAYPWPDFSWLPTRVRIGEKIQFTDRSIVKGDPTKVSRLWTFQDANPVNSSQQNPEVKFLSGGEKLVNLEITDSDGFSCTGQKTIDSQLSLPEWREVKPF